MKKTGLQKRIFEGLFIMLFIRLLLFPSGRSFFFRLTLHELSTLYPGNYLKQKSKDVQMNSTDRSRCTFCFQYAIFLSYRLHGIENTLSKWTGCNLDSFDSSSLFLVKSSPAMETSDLIQIMFLKNHTD